MLSSKLINNLYRIGDPKFNKIGQYTSAQHRQGRGDERWFGNNLYIINEHSCYHLIVYYLVKKALIIEEGN